VSDISAAQAAAHVLAKQGLAGGRLPSVLDAVEATAGIYSTAPTCYLSSAARVEGFRLADLDKELYAARSAARVRCMRGMAYIAPTELMPVLFSCTGEARDRTITRIGKVTGLGGDRVLGLADRIEAAMAGRPPMSVPEIRKALGTVEPEERDAIPMAVALLGRFGRIVRAQVRGGWRSDNFTYARWADWMGELPAEMDAAEARIELARRYLRAFGPATVDDLKWWSGWTKRDATPALTSLAESGEIIRVSVDGVDSWLPADETIGEAVPSVRLLPIWDAYFMAYATSGRARQVAPSDYPRVYDKSGNGTSVVLQDGMAAGIWELDADGGLITVAPFGDLRWPEIEDEIGHLSAAIGTDLRLERAPEPGPLSEGPRNTFLSPISLRRK